MKVIADQLSRTGDRRRNEDRCGMFSAGTLRCFALADGSGGHGAGDRAAELALAAVGAELAGLPGATGDAVRVLLDAAHRAVLRGQQENPAGHDMHATLVVLLIDEAIGAAAWGHIGDSRLYCVRDGQVLHRTLDHSVVQTLLGAGFITALQALDHPNRSQLLSALGSEEEPVSDVAGPEPLRSRDAFLLCSDGWWESLAPGDIPAMLAPDLDPAEWLARMEARILLNPRSNRDNYSAVAILLQEDEEMTIILNPDSKGART
ncbi:MAG: protein phosphatase 2C domain-containing protein [Opitutaceae bacterium]|nr:protein phosphatase 2C domain-containing protein [Opitutaceae bacterium]